MSDGERETERDKDREKERNIKGESRKTQSERKY